MPRRPPSTLPPPPFARARALAAVSASTVGGPGLEERVRRGLLAASLPALLPPAQGSGPWRTNPSLGFEGRSQAQAVIYSPVGPASVPALGPRRRSRCCYHCVTSPPTPLSGPSSAPLSQEATGLLSPERVSPWPSDSCREGLEKQN